MPGITILLLLVVLLGVLSTAHAERYPIERFAGRGHAEVKASVNGIDLKGVTNPPNRIMHRGKEIFLSGINVAWGPVAFANDIAYLDPACTLDQCVTDQQYFENMFRDLNAHGANSMRFWLHPDGGPLPVANHDYSDRVVIAPTQTQLNSIRFVLDLGAKYGIYVNLCLWSFDMVNDNGYGIQYGLWNKVLTDQTATDAYINNWLTPVVNEFKSHLGLLSFEVFNEPEGMMSEGTTFPWGWTNCKSMTPDCARVTIHTAQRFANLISSKIHDIDSNLKVTVGSWSYLASSNINGAVNIWSDSNLIAAGGKANGVLDYYQIHFYNWAYPDYSPFTHNASWWRSTDKPHVIGEFPNNPIPFTSSSPSQGSYCYEALYKQGYSGAWGWCYNCDNEIDYQKQTYMDNMMFMWNKYGKNGWPQV